MKKILAITLAIAMVLSLAACGGASTTTETPDNTANSAAAEEKADSVEEKAEAAAPAEEAAAAEEILTEEAAAEARDAGTLVGDPYAGYDYVESNDTWYYSNYPNYKDFKEDGAVKVAFVCKFSGVWFTPKANSLGETVEDAGYEYLFIDANSDEQAWLDGVQNIINQDFDAVVLTPVNTALLPDAIDMLQEAGIAYLTTDDPGADTYGFYSPHYGLDDYYLYNELGKVAADTIEERGFFDDIADDYSDMMFVILDSPAVEAIHNRSLGYYDAIMAKYPDIPESQILWLDCGAGLGDDIINKLGPTLQANKETVKKWVITSGTGSAVEPGKTLLEENGIDFNNVIFSETCATDSVMDVLRADETGAFILLGLVSKPSGTGMGNLIIDLVENGTPIPAFTPYDFILVNHDTVDDFYNKYFAE